MHKTALVVIADGSEEMEATIAIDVLRRAGIDVTVAGLDGPGPVTCSRRLVIQPDAALSEVRQPFDVLVLPGGAGGADAFANSEAVGELLRRYEKEGRLVGAICAAPKALAAHGVFAGKRMTSHPSVTEHVAQHADVAHGPVVEDGALVTSQGPGTAFDFALTLVERLGGAERAQQVKKPMMLGT